MLDMEVTVSTRIVDGTLIIKLPKEVVDELKLHENELVIVKIEKAKKDYFGALKGLSPFTKEDELLVHDE